jgi:predicted nucleotidyltransferase
MQFLPRDFIETGEGLFFAVVDSLIEDGRVLCFLRYGCLDGGTVKLDTATANALLKTRYPAYLFYSRRLDANLHAVPLENIKRHHTPRARVQQLLALDSVEGQRDAIEFKLLKLLDYLVMQGIASESIGVTGSLLISRQHAESDIDLVFYDRGSFFLARQRVVEAIEQGVLQALDEADWIAAWERRGCGLDFDVFARHERRKGNKGMVDGVKFDLALVADEPRVADSGVWAKHGNLQVRARVTADANAYDQPARYVLDHDEIGEILCFTHTYVGQARVGEMLEACGMLEISQEGRRRLVVGSSREAPGEFIRVLWGE